VGIIGIGGLGHLAIQFGKALGADIVAITRTKDKEAECKEFGASKVIVDSDFPKEKGTFDVLLSTIAGGDLNWNDYLSLLKNRGTLCLLGIPHSALSINPGFIPSGKRIVGSMVGSRSQIREMLKVAAKSNIKAKIETMPLSECQAAIERVQKNQVRYRMILTMTPSSKI